MCLWRNLYRMALDQLYGEKRLLSLTAFCRRYTRCRRNWRTRSRRFLFIVGHALVVALFEGMGTGLRRVEIKRCHFRQDGCHYFTSTLRAEVADEGENWKLPRITVRNCESNLDPLILPKPLSTRSSDTVLWNDIINLCSNECCRQEMCQLDFSDKPVPNMTYNVFSGTLNRAILQDTIEPNASHCPLFWTSR